MNNNRNNIIISFQPHQNGLSSLVETSSLLGSSIFFPSSAQEQNFASRTNSYLPFHSFLHSFLYAEMTSSYSKTHPYPQESISDTALFPGCDLCVGSL